MNKHEIDLTDCKVLIVDDLPANLDVLSQAWKTEVITFWWPQAV